MRRKQPCCRSCWTCCRRSFLKGAGVVGAAGLLSACGGSKSNNSGSTHDAGALQEAAAGDVAGLKIDVH